MRSSGSGYRRYDALDSYRDRPRQQEEAIDYGVLAPWDKRIPAFLFNRLAPIILGLIPVLGFFVSIGFPIWTWILFRRGLDVGAKLTGLRVVRDTGELAGFFHMWTRQLASLISLIVLGAGYWTAFSDPRRQTWHDKMMGTYVVKDSPDLQDLPGTSSTAAVVWFWISAVVIVVVVAIMLLLVAAALSDGFV